MCWHRSIFYAVIQSVISERLIKIRQSTIKGYSDFKKIWSFSKKQKLDYSIAIERSESRSCTTAYNQQPHNCIQSTTARNPNPCWHTWPMLLHTVWNKNIVLKLNEIHFMWVYLYVIYEIHDLDQVGA
jgi:hypothetical protein